jgi:hypothetical protein
MLRRAAQVSVIDHVTIVGFDKRVREVVWLAGAGDFCLEFSQGRSVLKVMNTLEREKEILLNLICRPRGRGIFRADPLR